MHKITIILLFISMLNISVFANITEEDVDEYLCVSRGGILVKHTYMRVFDNSFSKIYGIKLKNSDKTTIEKYKAFIFNPKYTNDFTKIFKKLDNDTYFEIMAFYKTVLGKKYTQAFKKLYDDDTATTLLKYLKQKDVEPFLKKKRKLIIEINKTLYSKLHIDLGNDIFVIGSSKKIQKDKIPSVEKIANSKEEYKKILDEYFAILSELAYKDFSDEELSQILAYAKAYGHIEMKFFYEAFNINKKHLYKDLYEFMEKEKNTKKALKDF